MQSAWLSMPMAMSSNDSPVAALKSIPSTNTVESSWMPHYILEDIIAAPGHGRVCCYLCGGIAFKLASCCIMKSTSKPSLFLYGISVVVSSFNCMLLYQSNHILVSSQRSQHLFAGNSNGDIGLCFGVDFSQEPISTRHLKSNASFDLEVSWKELFFEC
jgi:hypothetical protein